MPGSVASGTRCICVDTNNISYSHAAVRWTVCVSAAFSGHIHPVYIQDQDNINLCLYLPYSCMGDYHCSSHHS